MKKILIVSALSQELNAIKSEIKKLKIPNLKISYFSTGMNNYNMILNLTKFLSENKDFDFVLNVWICWYLKEKKDFFQVVRIYNSANKKELLVPNILDFWDLESIFCSEKVVTSTVIPAEAGILKISENFVDMESFWFETVLDSFSIPRIILKVPVDKIGEETINFDYKKAEKYLKENINYEELLQKISKYLEKKKQNIDFEKYFSNFSFTFSEKVIFKKLFFKFNALTSENFEKYFDDNRQKSKENFLKDLENFLKNYML